LKKYNVVVMPQMIGISDPGRAPVSSRKVGEAYLSVEEAEQVYYALATYMIAVDIIINACDRAVTD